MLWQTAPIKYHWQAHQHAAEVTLLVGMIDPPLGIIATPDVAAVNSKIGTGSVVSDPANITMDIGVAAVMGLTRAAPDHSTDLHVVTTCDTEAQSLYCYHHDTTLQIFIPWKFSRDDCRSPTQISQTLKNQDEDLQQVCKQCIWKIRPENTKWLQMTTSPGNTIAQMIRIVTPRMIYTKRALSHCTCTERATQ